MEKAESTERDVGELGLSSNKLLKSNKRPPFLHPFNHMKPYPLKSKSKTPPSKKHKTVQLDSSPTSLNPQQIQLPPLRHQLPMLPLQRPDIHPRPVQHLALAHSPIVLLQHQTSTAHVATIRRACSSRPAGVRRRRGAVVLHRAVAVLPMMGMVGLRSGKDVEELFELGVEAVAVLLLD